MGCRNLKDLRDLMLPGSEAWKRADEQYQACLKNEAIAAIMDRLSKLLARKAALQYIQCRLGGGSAAECMGFYDLVVPPPPGPELDEWFDDFAAEDRVAARGFLREALVMRAKELEVLP
jgi:hypothetical protein